MKMENIAMIELVSADMECEATEMQFDGGRREQPPKHVFPLLICCCGPWQGIVSYLRDWLVRSLRFRLRRGQSIYCKSCTAFPDDLHQIF